MIKVSKEGGARTLRGAALIYWTTSAREGRSGEVEMNGDRGARLQGVRISRSRHL